jgi:hypothetical protein
MFYVNFAISSQLLFSSPQRASSLARLELLNELLRGLLPVTLGVVLGPAPKILASILKRALGTPAELGVGAGSIGSKVENITSTARGDLVGKVTADSGGEGLDHLVDGAAPASTQVPGADTRVVLAEVVKSREVAI